MDHGSVRNSGTLPVARKKIHCARIKLPTVIPYAAANFMAARLTVCWSEAGALLWLDVERDLGQVAPPESKSPCCGRHLEANRQVPAGVVVKGQGERYAHPAFEGY